MNSRYGTRNLLCPLLLLSLGLLAGPILTLDAAGAGPAASLQAAQTECRDGANCLDPSLKREFERLCAQTEIATGLGAGELRQLIADSNALIGRLQKLDHGWARLYIFRLKNCRNFFQYALDLKGGEPEA